MTAWRRAEERLWEQVEDRAGLGSGGKRSRARKEWAELHKRQEDMRQSLDLESGTPPLDASSLRWVDNDRSVPSWHLAMPVGRGRPLHRLSHSSAGSSQPRRMPAKCSTTPPETAMAGPSRASSSTSPPPASRATGVKSVRLGDGGALLPCGPVSPLLFPRRPEIVDPRRVHGPQTIRKSPWCARKRPPRPVTGCNSPSRPCVPRSSFRPDDTSIREPSPERLPPRVRHCATLHAHVCATLGARHPPGSCRPGF